MELNEFVIDDDRSKVSGQILWKIEIGNYKKFFFDILQSQWQNSVETSVGKNSLYINCPKINIKY